MSKCEHAPDKLAHYARACTDILFQFPFGNQVRLSVLDNYYFLRLYVCIMYRCMYCMMN